MGLDTSHGCWNGSYHWFADWRNAIATAASYVNVRDDYPSRTYQGWWDETPEDILDVLFIHSDCDGWIFPHHCETLAARLRELAELVEKDWKELTVQFAEGLELAESEWMPVRFA